MRIEHLKGLSAFLIGALLLLGSAGIAQADTTNKPYLKTFGSDIMSGGWFSNGTNCATGGTSNYQDPNFSAPGFTSDTRDGGILTYANQSSGNSAGGASSQYGAFSLGEVDGRRAGDGFYSAGAGAATGLTPVNMLSFANVNNTYAFGGAFEGSVRQSNCIADYYSKKPASATNVANLSAAIAAGSGNYSATPASGSNFDLTAGTAPHTIPASQRITIYVNGNVYIDGNIVYDPASTVSSVPKFALIASGSIYIDKSVTQLDGMYVAEPSDTSPAAVAADNGIIWTCHPDNTAKLDYTYPPNCNSPLVVNGALIAKQVNWLRVKGDVGSANSAEDGLSTVNSCIAGSCNVSEVVNYTPATIMGGGFFSAAGSTSSGLPVDSIVSLPPVF